MTTHYHPNRLVPEAGRQGLHLAETGVYKTASAFIKKSSYFSSQLVVI